MVDIKRDEIKQALVKLAGDKDDLYKVNVEISDELAQYLNMYIRSDISLFQMTGVSFIAGMELGFIIARLREEKELEKMYAQS